MLHIFLLGDYFKSEIIQGVGRNCPTNQIIDTENKCMAAVDFLSMDSVMFYMGPSNSRDFPAGCYYKGGFGYFNKITDPSQTFPYNFYGIGGLCMEIGKYSCTK